VCFTFLHTRLRVQRAPGIPHALCFSRRWIFGHDSGALCVAGMRGRVPLPPCVSTSLRAERSNPRLLPRGLMDCFASLAMTNQESRPGCLRFESVEHLSLGDNCAGLPFPPPLWGRVREGGGRIGTARVNPLPNPPPQGGREPTADAEVWLFELNPRCHRARRRRDPVAGYDDLLWVRLRHR
jgi:hypothetical protein